MKLYILTIVLPVKLIFLKWQNDQIVIHKLFYGMINNFTSVKERDLTLFQRV